MTMPRLRRLLTLEARERAADGSGGFRDMWGVKGTLWAEVTPRSGRARSGDAGPVTSVSYRIVVRSAAPTSPLRPREGQRYREGDRLFRIVAVTEHDHSERFLACFAEEERAI